MRSYGRGFVSAVDPYSANAPGPDGLVRCVECAAWFGDLDELRAAGLTAYPEKCRECREGDRKRRGARFAGAPSSWRGLERRAHAPAAAR